MGSVGSNVWFCGQRPRSAMFPGDWYSGRESEHGAKTVPELAAAICRTYFAPGQRIGDPMCGTGVILVEAARAGLHAEGLELEQHYLLIAADNAANARVRTGLDVRAYPGDARRMDLVMLPGLDGIVCDIPYGAIRQDGGRHQWGKHGALTNYSGEDRLKRTGRNPANLGNLRYPDFLEQMEQVYRSALAVTLPTGIMVLIARNYRAQLAEVDLAGDTKRVAEKAGWRFHQEIIALTSPVQVVDGHPVIRPVVSAPQRRNASFQTEREGLLQEMYVFNNVLVFKRQDRPKGSQ